MATEAPRQEQQQDRDRSDREKGGVSRRALLAGAVSALGAGVVRPLLSPTGLAAAQPGRAVSTPPPRTPHEDLVGTITPSDLHYAHRHGVLPRIDPAHYTLHVHGMVERPLHLTLDDLKRFPSVSRVHFLECARNYRRDACEESTPRDIAGLTGNSEWTGVLLSTLFREAGARPSATWVLVEAHDTPGVTRSVPAEKAWDDTMVAYAQNGEALHPAHGFPVRLLCPGWAGYMSVKWLRRIELSDRPAGSYAAATRCAVAYRPDATPEPRVLIEPRSIVTSPSYPQTVRPGRLEVQGLAWSGRGRIARVEISLDEGMTWRAADLQAPLLPKAYTRFRYLWRWDGRETTILSRATDEAGYLQPAARRELTDARGGRFRPAHLNQVIGWRIRADGSVVFRTEASV